MKWKELVSRVELAATSSRLRLVVTGRVQGVGFRPTVYRYASGAGLSGFVRNTRRGVVIEVEGSPEAINEFGRALTEEAPPLARIDGVDLDVVEPTGESGFVIEPSEGQGGSEALFPVDTSVCEDCLAEMRDPGNRRYRYPFINCTNCGPRFTIIEGLPYDRPMTTMKEFEMDTYCRSQYEDPADRRFHAEPISCPGCGPVLKLVDAVGHEIEGDPIDGAKRLLAAGKVVAVKGLGGYHLACMAEDRTAVELLRRRKGRPAKPFALMFRDIDAIERFCKVDGKERRLLTSPEAPIVLLRSLGDGLPDAVAPGNGYIGAFLPYTPVHHLIMESFDVLVMTSANFTDEPLISTEEELVGILGGIADAALVNDRKIAHKCDDSIFFVPSGTVVPVRRARGFVPEPVPLPRPPGGVVLASGGQVKGTFAISRGGKAFISPHLGDLGDLRGQVNYRRELEDFERILEVSPELVVCDMHPDYFTTRLAEEISCGGAVRVQHHHAHAVSVMVEHGLEGPVIAVAFDGTGYGVDGRLWGGEFLLARYEGFERIAHFKYLPLPGGEVAIREPWRMALVHSWNLLGDGVLGGGSLGSGAFEGLPAGDVLELMRRGINSPMTSSVGRLFDAVACLLGCGNTVSYEAESAVALESLALGAGEPEHFYRFDFIEGDTVEIEPAPVIEAVLKDLECGRDRRLIAAAFHHGVAHLIVDLAVKLASRHGCGEIVLSGGVFQNRLLCEKVFELADKVAPRFCQHEIVPPNDGGISLGQLQAGAAMAESGIV